MTKIKYKRAQPRIAKGRESIMYGEWMWNNPHTYEVMRGVEDKVIIDDVFEPVAIFMAQALNGDENGI